MSQVSLKSVKTAAASLQGTTDDLNRSQRSTSDLRKRPVVSVKAIPATQQAKSKLKTHQSKKKNQRLDRLEKMYNELTEKQ